MECKCGFCVTCLLLLNSTTRFRWAACQLDLLEKHCLDYRILQKALASVPRTLGETYSRMLHEIPLEFRPSAIRLLQLLTYCMRPMRVKEAVDAIAVDLNANPRFKPENRMPIPQEISRYCMGLVTVTPTEASRFHSYYFGTPPPDQFTELRLAHFSVKVYLLSDQLDIHFAPLLQDSFAHTAIASVCVGYLLHIGHSLPEREVYASFPFAEYCAEYWIRHAVRGNGDDKGLCNMATDFFLGRLLLDQGADDEGSGWSMIGKALIVASSNGLEKIVESLLERGANVNDRSILGDSALHVACLHGHERVVRVLLARGADINTQDGYSSPPKCLRRRA
jgi:hypothetical protein